METLDLHGVRHADAEIMVIDLVEKKYNSGEMVKVVTGNSQIMKDIVFKNSF